MNIPTLCLPAIVLLTMTVHPGIVAEPVHVPASPEAAASANLIARAGPRSAGLRRLKVGCRGFAHGSSTHNPWQLRDEAARSPFSHSA